MRSHAWIGHGTHPGASVFEQLKRELQKSRLFGRVQVFISGGKQKEKSLTATNTNPQTPVWFVTGTSSGFGCALAQAALDRGHSVVATSRDVKDVQYLVDRFPGRALALKLDVTDPAVARDAVREAVAHFGRIDFVFNNAGFGYVGAIEELSDQQLREQLEVDLYGVINVTRAALPQLRKQRAGHFIQMSSLNGVEALAGAGYYCASKFGIEGFSETLAAEVAHLGIKVTIVEPGPFRTRFLNDESVKWAKPIADYAESVGKSRETLRAMNGKQPGDPDRAALAIIQATEAVEPPLRLPLGKMALDHILAVLRGRLKELDAWADVAAAADFPTDEATQRADGSGEKLEQAHENLVQRAYQAFNSREIEGGVALMDPDVDWANVPQGGFIHGHEQVRDHWRQQFVQVDPYIEVADIRERPDGRVEARVRQIVRRRDGAEVTEERQIHVFTIENGRIKRMEVRAPRS
jgi:NAD(P)-dependent dehydrogenase (short-subunit alcohol dehydrogenase family)/ketosteroid isomerase-like protein